MARILQLAERPLCVLTFAACCVILGETLWRCRGRAVMEERALAQQPTEQTQCQPASQRLFPPHASYNPLHADLWRKMSTLKISVASAVSRLLLLTVCVLPALSTACASASSAHTSGVIRPTATMTPTLPPFALSCVTVGSTRDEFARKLGAPIERYSDPWYPVTLPDGTTAYLGFFVEHTGSDGAPHIAGFHVDGPGDTRWSDEQCAAIGRAFVLPDAKQVSHSTTSWSAQVDVYVSADLARTFPASEFKDVLGDQVAPGTFTVVCPDSAPQDWDIHTGT